MRKALSSLNLLFTTIFLSVIALIISPFDSRGKLIHGIAKFWATTHIRIGGIKVVTSGLDNIATPPYIFMCNHQSALDIYGLLCSLPLSFRWIAKRQLFLIPLFGWALKRGGHISIDRENPREALKAIDEAARKIREGMNIIIFPEGTRSMDGSLLPFKKGGFSLALRAMVPIVPVGIVGTSTLQPKGSFIPKRKGVIYIHIGKPISLEGMARSAKGEVMNSVRASIERLMQTGEGSSDG
ncbi:MAG: lysophospholipid acyltransferase family protein [Syntrophorhabdaceae bacterium]|nr:lysophospholipid acyltransferase family protein [Syntrophorhabdaceae bacterium]MDD5243746.1 lysophospholipid acyltransferase family protein [Syntrophorhabdaceae bacterium]